MLRFEERSISQPFFTRGGILRLSKPAWTVVLVILASSMLSGCSRSQARTMTSSKEKPGLETRVELVRSTAEDIVVRVVMVNRGTATFALLRWNLPESGELSGPLFEISRNGQQIAYHGKMVKRRVTSESYRALKPGSEYSATISLAQAYDVRQPGRYKIRYHAWNQTDPATEPADLAELTSTELVVDK